MIGDPLCPFYSDTDAAEAREPDDSCEAFYDAPADPEFAELMRARRAAELAVAADVAEAEGKLLGYLDERGDITW